MLKWWDIFGFGRFSWNCGIIPASVKWLDTWRQTVNRFALNFCYSVVMMMEVHLVVKYEYSCAERYVVFFRESTIPGGWNLIWFYRLLVRV